VRATLILAHSVVLRVCLFALLPLNVMVDASDVVTQSIVRDASTQCRYYWYSDRQAEIKHRVRIYDDESDFPQHIPDVIVRLHGQWMVYTEVTNEPKPTGHFTDYDLLGVRCGVWSGPREEEEERRVWNEGSPQ